MTDPQPSATRGDDTAPLAARPEPRREVCGRYLVRVEALAWSGEARARVLEAIEAPAPEDLARVYGPRAQEPIDVFALIGGLPGEVLEVEARWLLPRPGRRPARRVPPPRVQVLRVIEAAPNRVAPRCPVFGECGGCQLQHMTYDAQLAWKAERVRAALVSAGFEAPPVAATIGCEPPWGYRNHMRFSVDFDGRMGLTARGSRRVLPLSACPIAHPRIGEALAALAGEPQPRPQVLLRYGIATDQLLMRPAPSNGARGRLAALGLDPRTEDLEEDLHCARFRIRPSSFFQTNTAQAERMADLVLAALPTGPDVTLVDAYCGVGTFARLLAEGTGTAEYAELRGGDKTQGGREGHEGKQDRDWQCERREEVHPDNAQHVSPSLSLLHSAPNSASSAVKSPAIKVIAIEESASAVRDARWNLRDVPNVAIVQAKVEEVLPQMTERLDGLVIDPPRAGCQRPVLDALAARRVPRVVYVSCDPDTLARDLAYLCLRLSAYRLVSVQPLDMFPQTAHVESVATLEAR